MSERLGADAQIFYSTGSDIESMTELANVRNATLSLECEPQDSTPNSSGGWRASTHSLRSASFEWDILWDTSDAGMQALRDAYLNDTPILLRFDDGSASDPLIVARGFSASCIITKFKRSERLTDAVSVSVAAKPTLSTVDPAWLDGLIDADNSEWVYDDITGTIVLVAA